MEELAFNQDYYLSEKFLEIKNEYNLNTVIETGTYHGTTTSWFSKHFKDVYTIESQSAHFEEASKIIGHINNIKMSLGDSSELLKEILPSIDDNKTIIFLDAHWYTNPVLAELDAIKESGKLPILAIHDFMVPDHPEFGYDEYPDQNIVYNWEWIEGHINSIYGKGGYSKDYNAKATGSMRGCLFIFPNKDNK
jgi:cephalosporin hydroxylase